MTWTQRPAGTRFPDSPSDEFHGCLDALIVTIREMRDSLAVVRTIYGDDAWAARGFRFLLERNIREAEERATICAGLLFDRWIEETDEPKPSQLIPGHVRVEDLPRPPECAKCRSRVIQGGYVARGVREYMTETVLCPAHASDPSQIKETP